MSGDKKPAPEGEVYIYGNTKVEFRKDGLTITVGESEELALTPKDLGPYFKELRERAGLTLEETSKVTGTDIGELKSAEEYGFTEKSISFYCLCSLLRLNGDDIGKRYGLPLSWRQIRVKELEDRAKASETEKNTENQAEAAPAKPSKQYPTRAMFISLILTNVATLLLCVGQLLMWIAR